MIGLYITYGLVIFFKLFLGGRRFKPGPIYTGKTVSFCLNVVAVTYVLFMTSIFIMPTAYPTTSTTLNWCGPPCSKRNLRPLNWPAQLDMGFEA